VFHLRNNTGYRKIENLSNSIFTLGTVAAADDDDGGDDDDDDDDAVAYDDDDDDDFL